MGTHTLNIDGRLKKNRIINNEIIAIEVFIILIYT
jgi:hypothetical protein